MWRSDRGTTHGITRYRLDSLTVIYPGRDDVFLNSLPADTRDALLVEHPTFPHFAVISTEWTHVVQLTTLGANVLARYMQFVGELYLIPFLLRGRTMPNTY